MKGRSIQQRLLLTFLLVITVLLLLSGIVTNRIILAYLGRNEGGELSRRAQMVAAVTEDAFLVTNLADLRAIRPQLEKAAGVKITLVQSQSEMREILPDYPNSLAGKGASPYRAVVPFVRGGVLQALIVLDPVSALNPARREITQSLVVLGAAGLGVAALLAFWLSRSISQPLERLTRATTEIGAGNLEHRLPEDRGDELGMLAHNFNRMSDHLRESFRLLGAERDRLRDFIGEMSHELRTPLTALSTFNELLLDGADADPAVREEFLRNSGQQIARMRQLTENLLQLSRLDSGMSPMELAPADLRAVLEDSLDRLEGTAALQAVRLAGSMPETPVPVLGDPSRLAQALDNLIGNGIKYTPGGGTVSVALTVERDKAVLRVEDTGPGIAAEDVPKLFQRFYRGKNQPGDEPGSGLGLAVVKAVIEAHGGTVALTDPEKAEFTVTLPLAAGDGGGEEKNGEQ